jgi:hypothetical protein
MQGTQYWTVLRDVRAQSQSLVSIDMMAENYAFVGKHASFGRSLRNVELLTMCRSWSHGLRNGSKHSQEDIK